MSFAEIKEILRQKKGVQRPKCTALDEVTVDGFRERQVFADPYYLTTTGDIMDYQTRDRCAIQKKQILVASWLLGRKQNAPVMFGKTVSVDPPLWQNKANELQKSDWRWLLFNEPMLDLTKQFVAEEIIVQF